MKFSTLFATLAIFATSTLALTDEEALIARIRSEDPAGAPDILKRACNYNTPCKGYGWSVGLHCGDGAYGCVKGHVYQIGSDTNVCDYGVRKSCQQCGKLSC
ncbi:hypothetical protein FRC14_006555 [Serendipita sp. 396]|nr:hypothetical protein FRC14_006555 [Serendipita sp. 396]KAG8800940.1 hypothetical protein FRC16_001656 [Serendipita sp. 398]KAG8824470.1 hypothetical protein FRC19_001723 [Serendipita sp. 401]KAG8838962.1 hypothetical protein FRC18_001781 [Serendipita sp. 400]KAG8853803.1 hypothetical protein FRB91_004335 [Serendipita sp. 411]KAG8871721.1 hypothetical protein FRC20_010249 [Serendipita sp. 405]KAG9053767.1 hypothetical protein FS842_007205 [Serendipita sp. 407]